MEIPMRALLLALVLALPACKNPNGTDDTEDVDHGPIIGIGLTPYNPTVEGGKQLQLAAEGFYEDGAHVDVTRDVAWISSEGRVATVTDTGLLTGLGGGTTDVVATYEGGVSAKITVTVKDEGVTVVSVAATPSALQVRVGETAQITATATYSDDSTGNVSGSCEWSSTNDGIARALAGGRIEGVAVGNTSVSATCEGNVSNAVTVTVESADAVLPQADLAVDDLVGSATASGDVELHARIRNVGDGYAGGFWVQAFLDSTTTPTNPNADDDYTWIPGLGAGDQTQVSFLILDPGPGTYQSWVVADLLEEVEEAADRNNYAGPVSVTVQATTTGSANLAITNMVAIGDSSYTLYSITVKNTGTVMAPSCWMDLFYSPADLPEAGPNTLGDDFVHVPALAPGAQFLWEPEVNDGPAFAGDWYSCVLADSNQDVTESNEDDNLECVDVELFR